MKIFYCPHCSQEITGQSHISKMHPSSIAGDYKPKISTIGSTSNVYSPRAGSSNNEECMRRMLLSQKLDQVMDLQRTTNKYLGNIFYAITAK